MHSILLTPRLVPRPAKLQGLEGTMANFNYTHRLRAAEAACLMSETCSWCYHDGKRNSFFGVPMTGGTIMGHRPQDRDFQKAIWIAAQKHYREVHGREVVRNGAGGWKVQKVS